MPEILGSGGAFLDYDNDGDLDIYLVQGAPLTPGQRSPAGNRLFRNDGATADGTPRFTDVTDAAGVGLKAVGMGVAVGDVDNDGWLDLYVTAFGSNVLYRNNGNGTFADVTRAGRRGRSTLEHERRVLRLRPGRRPRSDRGQLRRLHGCRQQDLHRSCWRTRLLPAGATFRCPTRLFRNDGGLRFTDVTGQSRLGTAYGAGLGVAVGDFDRRRLARYLRCERRHAEPALDEPPRRHVRRPRVCWPEARERGRAPRGQHGHRRWRHG